MNELALRPEDQAVHGLELAERVFTPARREAISRFLNVEPEDPALVPYLATCASYGLDPVMGQIWLIPQRVKVRDGDVERWRDRNRPSVGRDGYLAIARRDPRYRGMRYGVVCEHDTFEVHEDETDPRVRMLPWGFPDLPVVMHRYASKPTAGDGNPARWRGRILGAWCKVYAHGQPPEFHYAAIHEHVKMREKWEGKGSDRRRVTDAQGRPVMEPDGAWHYASTMILKAVQSYVLRIAFGITGLVPADELVGGQLGAIEASAEQLPEESAFDWERLEIPDDLRERLEAAVEAANEASPLSWPAAKVEMVMLGRPVDELAALAVRIEDEARAASSARVQAAESRSEEPEGGSSSEPDPPGEGVTEAQVVERPDLERLEALMARQSRLADDLNDPAVSEDDREQLAQELAGVEREIAAVVDPGQGRLGV